MLIDFESRFGKYMDEYRQKHDINDDAFEELAPELYLRWLDLPMDDLNGKSPNSYFEGMSAADLVSVLGEYFFSDIPIPGPLLNRIADTKQETFPFIRTLLFDFEGERSDEFKAVLAELIDEMDMPRPYAYYIKSIADSAEDSEFSEACVETLKGSGESLKEELIAALESAIGDFVADCFLDILAGFSFDERVYTYALDKFLYSTERRAFYANCLGRLGNDSALPYLEAALKEEGLSYFDYVSIRNALEELGGEVQIDRDFTGDKDYDLLADMGDK